MKQHTIRALLVLGAVALLSGVTGCATSRDYKLKCQPVTDYPKAEQLDLSVALELRNEFAGGVVFERPPVMMSPGVRYRVPGAMEASAEALARALFQRVQVVKEPVYGPTPAFDAVVRPRVVTVEEAYDLKGGVHLLLEWTVTRPNGQMVWKKTIRGEGMGSLSQKALFQRAMEDAFRRSHEQMSTSPEIKALPDRRMAEWRSTTP